jgi:hypothetical protein
MLIAGEEAEIYRALGLPFDYAIALSIVEEVDIRRA